MLPPASDRASVGRGEKVPETPSAACLAPRPASSVDALNLIKRTPCRGYKRAPDGRPEGRRGQRLSASSLCTPAG